ncbi:type III effector protein [Streptomyces sp. NBC_01497]|uniref:type III effector protein n=1 Tax=Streptomyces sp. NBC_01497 TaxID=2903885 RepID=UPI002E38017F|nr:type III effector protein [Streptomyces sp. NBC_01497]
MTAADQDPSPPPTSFLAAKEALKTIEDAVLAAQQSGSGGRSEPGAGADQVLAALLLLRQMRDQLAGWESGLIETAREAGASWADLAEPLGVANRQSAERRYLRLRPGAPGSTGEQRIQATRDHRAAERTVTTWARGNAGDLRRLAGAISDLTDLPDAFRRPLVRALGQDDVAVLLTPLAATREHLAASHPDLAARLDSLTRHTDDLRQASGDERHPHR